MLLNFQFGAFATLATVIGASATSSTTDAPPIVTLNGSATVVGTRNAVGLEIFLGIPYAQPPIGPLRYDAPAPVFLSASTVINASAYGPVCLQTPSVSLVLSNLISYSLQTRPYRTPSRSLACPRTAFPSTFSGHQVLTLLPSFRSWSGSTAVRSNWEEVHNMIRHP